MSILITILQNGPNVVMSGGGTANTSALTAGSSSTQGARIAPSSDYAALYGNVNLQVTEYTGISNINPDMGNGGFTNAGNLTGPDSFGISELGIPKVARLYLYDGYVSGVPIGPTTATFFNKNFTDLGINRGVYTWTWGSGANADSFTIQVGPPPAVLNLYLNEVGSDVVFSGTGTVNTTSFSSPTSYSLGSSLNGDLAELISAPSNGLRYNGYLSGPVNFGSPVSSTPNSTGGDTVGVGGFSNNIILPDPYVSETQINSSATFNSTNFSTLGVTPGTYTWTYGSGSTAGSIVLQIGPLPTPTPTATPTTTPTTTPTNTQTPTTTATNTQTPTTTATNTQTPTTTVTSSGNPVTPTNTPTTTTTPTVTNTSSPAGVTATPTVTATNTTTPSVTPTNTLTPTKTATPSVTPTNTPTPSNTPGVCKTYQLYGGTGDTTFVGRDCNGFTFTLQVQAYQTLVQCATEVYIVNGNGSYVSIGSCPLPTPTPSITASVTPSVTATPTLTPTTTTTLTLTPTKTATNTPTPTLTQTQTQTGTAAVTPSPTTTKTPTLTPTNTATPSVTPTNTMTPTKTGTPAVTPTKTSTPTVTSTPTGTPPATPTPTPTFFFTGFSADQQYAYTIDILGGFSGGTAPDGAIAPHPIFTDENGVPVQQLNGITLGGFNGLNN